MGESVTFEKDGQTRTVTSARSKVWLEFEGWHRQKDAPAAPAAPAPEVPKPTPPSAPKLADKPAPDLPESGSDTNK